MYQVSAQTIDGHRQQRPAVAVAAHQVGAREADPGEDREADRQDQAVEAAGEDQERHRRRAEQQVDGQRDAR